MADSHEGRFENPSKFFIWLYTIHSYFTSGLQYKKLISELHLQGNENVLEFGSGVGSLAKMLAPKLQKDGQLVCIDVSEKLLAHTKKRLKRFSNVQYLLGDITTLSIANESFDYIVSTWVLHHVEKNVLPQTIGKLTSIVKPDGKIFIIEFPDIRQHHKDFTQETFLNIFKEYGFQNKVLLTQKDAIMYEFTREKK